MLPAAADHPITQGINDVELVTEQYWVLSDDYSDVLATTTASVREWDPWHRPVTSPVIWTRRFTVGARAGQISRTDRAMAVLAGQRPRGPYRIPACKNLAKDEPTSLQRREGGQRRQIHMLPASGPSDCGCDLDPDS